jgi:type IX secretion system PorP/SprF family membrane protein
MKKVLIFAVVLIMINLSAVAQLQVGQGINSWFHKSPEVHNMSFIANRPVPTLIFLAGSRMDAFNNHPTQGSLLASGFIADGLGIGCKIDHEAAGLSAHLDVQLAFIYYVFLNKEKGDKLSFFLGGHFMQEKLSAFDVVVIDPNDPGLDGISQFQPGGNASAGFSFLRENTYYLGVSSTNLIDLKHSFYNPALLNLSQRTYYLVGGYTFRLNDKCALEFSGAGVFASSDAYAWETGLDFKFNKMFWVGAGYRSAGALKFDAGVTAQSWSFGYLCAYGSWVDATTYTYKAMSNSFFIRKVFNEGRSNK